jgi:hypothetical protein
MDFFAAGEAARRKLSVADHLLTQTYPLVKDPKLLLAVLQNLIEAVDAGVISALGREVSEKRLVVVPDDAEARLAAFRQAADRYGLQPEFFRFAEELRETLRDHQQSPVEFVRKEQLVICDDKYHLRTLSEEQLKQEILRAREFLGAIEKAATKVTEHDAVAPRRD